MQAGKSLGVGAALISSPIGISRMRPSGGEVATADAVGLRTTVAGDLTPALASTRGLVGGRE